MVIRRIREHVATQNWFAVAIDFLIVVAGIVIGTQVNNWNQARLDRNQAREYRDRLISDLRSNESDMQQRQAYYRAVRRHATDALGVIEQPSAPAGEEFLIDAFQATQIMPRTVKRFTYDEMIAAGGIDRLGSAILRERVANYYSNLQTTEVTLRATPPYREHLRQIMPYVAQQNVRSRCPEISGTDASGAATASLPKDCKLDLDPTAVARAVSQVRTSAGISEDLTRYLVDLDLKLELFALVGQRARNLRRALEAKGRRAVPG